MAKKVNGKLIPWGQSIFKEKPRCFDNVSLQMLVLLGAHGKGIACEQVNTFPQLKSNVGLGMGPTLKSRMRCTTGTEKMLHRKGACGSVREAGRHYEKEKE